MTGRLLLSGAAAGAATTVAFAALHHLLISNIWFSLVPMILAGAACGMCLAWSYALLFARVSVAGWFGWNMLFFALFVLLGAVSVIVYTPVYSMEALIAGNEPPRELMWQAMPLTVAFTLAATAAISLAWGRTLRKAAVVLLTCTVLIVLLGLNVSVLGLVQMTQGMAAVLGGFFGLIAAIMLGNAAVFYALERKRLFEAEAEAEAEAQAEVRIRAAD
jgi:uncharacterized membrane protein YuzA (DUF378 family)